MIHADVSRDLTAEDINLMCAIRAKEAEIAGLLRVLRGANSAPLRAGSAETARQIAIAQTEFEHAFMRLLRAVARPSSPWVG